MPAPPDPWLRRVCAAWLGDDVATIEPIATSGFSGARVCRVVGRDGGIWAAKSWASPDRDRIAWVHAFMQHLRAAGIGEIPHLATARRGGTVVVDDSGVSWELARWVDGIAVESPSVSQAVAAASCLARVHRAAAAWPACPLRHEPPAAVGRRVDQAMRLLAHPWQRLGVSHAADRGALASDVAGRLAQAVDLFVVGHGDRAMRRVAATTPPAVAGQAVLRDIWWEHVLFGQPHDRVAGVIDVHAAGIDTPATDLARLLGSWTVSGPAAADRAGHWEAALAAYEEIRPLEGLERRLVRWLDATGVVFGLDNWFRWVLTEARTFEQPGQVLRRIERLLDSLPAALTELADGDGLAV